MKKLIWLLPFVLLFSCKTTKQFNCDQCAKIHDTTTVTITEVREVLHDTTVLLPADTTAFVQALLACDSNNQVVVRQLTEKLGTKSRVNYTLAKNTFTARCVCDSSSIYLTWKERDTLSSHTATIKEFVKVPAQFSHMQLIYLRLGQTLFWLLILIVVLTVAYVILKLTKTFTLP